MKKTARSLFLLSLILLLALAAAGCGSLIDEQCAQYLHAYLTALNANDPEAAYALFMEGSIPFDSFQTDFFEHAQMWAGGDFSYAGTRRDMRSVGIGEGREAVISNIFRVTAGEKHYTIKIRRIESPEGSGMDRLTMEERSSARPVGYPWHFRQFNSTQWYLAGYSLLCIAFMAFVAIRVVKSPLKNIWILLTLLQGGVRYAVSPTSFQLSLTAYPIPLNQLILDPEGARIMTVCLPIGAIVLLCLRKHLLERQEAAAERQRHMQAPGGAFAYGAGLPGYPAQGAGSAPLNAAQEQAQPPSEEEDKAHE